MKKYFSKIKVNEVVGTVANTGRVSGQVKIIRKLNDLGSDNGFVLVSPMTTPDLMPAIRKSIAVITDEGGLTCHAAIIAREMKKPCIIGTKTATKILRNGDFVEVDAVNGIVKIIKRNDEKILK